MYRWPPIPQKEPEWMGHMRGLLSLASFAECYFLSSAYSIAQIDPGRMYMLARKRPWTSYASGVRKK